MRKSAIAILVFLLAGCGPPSPSNMTVRQWIKLDQKQRTEAIAELRADNKPYAADCERGLYNHVMFGKVNPQLMEARLPDALRGTCRWFYR